VVFNVPLVQVVPAASQKFNMNDKRLSLSNRPVASAGKVTDFFSHVFAAFIVQDFEHCRVLSLSKSSQI
jgi:hypothetical protein